MDDNLQQPSPVFVFFKNIWPTTHRIIYSAFYFILNLIKNAVSDMINQLKGQ